MPDETTIPSETPTSEVQGAEPESTEAPDESVPQSSIPEPDPAVIQAARRQTFDALPPEARANPEIRRTFGLGDAFEVLARPFARALGIKDCDGCKKRKERMNRMFSRGR